MDNGVAISVFVPTVLIISFVIVMIILALVDIYLVKNNEMTQTFIDYPRHHFKTGKSPIDNAIQVAVKETEGVNDQPNKRWLMGDVKAQEMFKDVEVAKNRRRMYQDVEGLTQTNPTYENIDESAETKVVQLSKKNVIPVNGPARDFEQSIAFKDGVILDTTDPYYRYLNHGGPWTGLAEKNASVHVGTA